MADVNGKPSEEDVSSFIFHEFTKHSKSTFLHKNFSIGNDYYCRHNSFKKVIYGLLVSPTLTLFLSFGIYSYVYRYISLIFIIKQMTVFGPNVALFVFCKGLLSSLGGREMSAARCVTVPASFSSWWPSPSPLPAWSRARLQRAGIRKVSLPCQNYHSPSLLRVFFSIWSLDWISCRSGVCLNILLPHYK